MPARGHPCTTPLSKGEERYQLISSPAQGPSRVVSTTEECLQAPGGAHCLQDVPKPATADTRKGSLDVIADAKGHRRRRRKQSSQSRLQVTLDEVERKVPAMHEASLRLASPLRDGSPHCQSESAQHQLVSCLLERNRASVSRLSSHHPLGGLDLLGREHQQARRPLSAHDPPRRKPQKSKP